MFSSNVLDAIRRESAAAPVGYETGGILLGDSDPLRLTVAGGPGPGAVRTKSFFLRDLQYSQNLAAQEAARSGAKWVGEWHTHPTGPAHPSPKDLSTYQRIQQDPNAGLSSGVLSLIVSPSGPGWLMTAWWCADGHGIQIVMEES
ncbi:Mov34/MPN/PAD-1 family protein [Microbacterium sp. Bi98]|uniref:Mov34/MPN/PAD-1 family protein n=1 Tax=Microbacterium sp. Bi98 TaxID=2821116 RepID=UPI0033AAB977